jgi:hypothetical protein
VVELDSVTKMVYGNPFRLSFSSTCVQHHRWRGFECTEISRFLQGYTRLTDEQFWEECVLRYDWLDWNGILNGIVTKKSRCDITSGAVLACLLLTMMLVLADSPAFPLELEREIFETTALLHPTEIPTLLRVARRVLIWSVLRSQNFFPLATHSEV